AAVRNLSNHGYLTTLKTSSGETAILLSPNLLTNLASSFVLEARRNPQGLGALDEHEVLRGSYSFPDLSGLAAGKREVLLAAATALFLKHNLCFRETLAQQTLLVFPSLINQKRPMITDIETVDDVSYHIVGPIENVYASLVVRLGYTNTFTRTHQWQNQAQYVTDLGDVCGFRQIADREGEIELVLYFGTRMSGSRLLFQGLFEQFLSSRDVTVTKYPPIVCPKCRYQQPRSGVIQRVRDRTGFLFCSNCAKKIPLPKGGEKVALSSSERARLEHSISGARTAYEEALVAVKGLAQSRKTAAPTCFVSYAWGDAGQERWVGGLATDLENAGVKVVLDRRDNAEIGRNIARFISRIEESDFVAVVGTPLYLKKFKNKLKKTGSVVAAEVDLIHQRLLGDEAAKETVLPLLLAGDEQTSFPPLLRGRVHADFLREEQYFASLFDLALILYRIPFDHRAVADKREALRGSVLSALPQ
ncbi:MAG TPA: toll/interleukin-1 receptor domain-containing protein, partial [Thermoanaerobaculia bacterium]|nr:toll/interleukin-1 receptor domain-containing protein [Thermoanaerobaculia bacterium]